MERGKRLEIENLEPENRQVLNRMQETVDSTVRDPAQFLAQMHEIHLRNAKAWANAAVGIDLANQIDPTFRFGPQVMPLASNTADGVGLVQHAPRNTSFDHLP
jgi:CO dehydrogenase maturation factor